MLVGLGKTLRFDKDQTKGIRQKDFGFEIVVVGINNKASHMKREETVALLLSRGG